MTVTDETDASIELSAVIGRITDDYAATADRTMNPLTGTIELLREANAEEFASPAYMAKSQEALDYAIEGLAMLDPKSDDAKVLAEAIAKLARFLANDWDEFNEPKIPPVMGTDWFTSMTASGDCAPCAEAAAESETFQSTPLDIDANIEEDGDGIHVADDSDDDDDDDERIPSKARWEGPIGYENEMTGDGRFLEEGSLRWENLPLPLRYVGVDVGAHDGAQVVATIDTIERLAPDADGAIPIWGAGDFDLGSEIGREAYRQVKGGWTTGVSMDLDDVTFEVHATRDLVDEAVMGNAPEMEDMAEDSDGRLIAAKYAPDDEVSVTTDGRIRAATIVAIPAFHKARIALTASGMVFAPGQARAPEGTPIGGQWIDTPSGLLSSVRNGESLSPVVAKVKEQGGASIDPATLAEPTDGYMVAVQGHNVEIPADEFFTEGTGEKALGDWMEANKEALSQPGSHIGLWHDEANGEVVFDVSQRVDTLDEAVLLGKERNQQAIWDVAEGVEVPTGGSGDRASTGGDSDDEALRARTRGVLRVERRGEAGLAGRGRQEGGVRADRVAFGGPNQARAPKGSPIGGRWIDTPSGILSGIGERTTQEGGFPQSPPLSGNHEPLAADAVDPNGKPYGADVVAASNKIHDQAVEREVKITGDIQSALDASPVEEHLEGLEYRVKEPESLAKKIRTKGAVLGVDAAAEGVHDAIRYTSISDGDGLSDSVDGVLGSLADKGYTVEEVKNFWTDPDLQSLAYKGINTKMVSPDGVKIELQFHTPESFKAKMAPEMHAIYDKQKLVPPGSAEFEAYEQDMRDYMTSIGVVTPKGF